MHMFRRVDGYHHNFLRFAVVTPIIAVHFTVVDFRDRMHTDHGEHHPCFTENCDDVSHISGCDLFGEADCHCFTRGSGAPDTLDDDIIFERLERRIHSFIERSAA
jgi:hypothetical protein